jgi:hypothetical protein
MDILLLLFIFSVMHILAINEMSLPADIPWKRMGVSADMMDPKYNDLQFPPKWNSSIAVFYHEPADVPPEYCNRKITYLKICCTITNYQPENDSITVLDELRRSQGDWYGLKQFERDYISNTYPCYGALLHVSVFPNPSDGVQLYDFPYISSFQPRKREMYETITQTGEVLSQSGVKTNVSKGMTSTDTLENYDLYLGGGGGSTFFGFTSSSDPQMQLGTINRDQKQQQDVRTTDVSREKRESNSFSTNINQLYSLLDGYHQGTNRCFFFMQPRPHVRDLKYTFVRGPQLLKGIQEFFLIIDRPSTVPGLCVEIALETAHFLQSRSYEPRIIRKSDLYSTGNLSKTYEALGINPNLFGDANYLEFVRKWNDLDFSWRRSVQEHVNHQKPLPAGLPPKVNDNQWAGIMEIAARLPDVIEDVALIFDEFLIDNGPMYVAGRKLCACMRSATPSVGTDTEHSGAENLSACSEPPSIVLEAYILSPDKRARFIERGREFPYTYGFAGISSNSRAYWDLDVVNVNSLVDTINRTLSASLRSGNRYPYGKISFSETEFMLDAMSQLVRVSVKNGVQDKLLDEVKDIAPEVSKKISKLKKVRTIADLGKLTTEKISKDMNVTNIEAKKIRFELLNKSLRELDMRSLEKITPVNLVQERLESMFEKEELKRLENSAGVGMKENKILKKRKNAISSRKERPLKNGNIRKKSSRKYLS